MRSLRILAVALLGAFAMLFASEPAHAQCPSSDFTVDVQGLYPPKLPFDLITVAVEFGTFPSLDSFAYTINYDQNTLVPYPPTFGAPTAFIIYINGMIFKFPIPGVAIIPDPSLPGGCFRVEATLDAAGCLTLKFTPC